MINLPTCKYVVKVRAAYWNIKTDENEFIATIKEFEDENPILAREKAFEYRNLIIAGLFDNLGLDLDKFGWDVTNKTFNNLSEREIRKLINPYLEPDNESNKTILKKANQDDVEIDWNAPDDSIAWYPYYNNGIWIIMEHNDNELKNDREIIIDKITRFDGTMPTPPLFDNLKLEYEFYKKHKYDTKDYDTSVVFFDDEEFLDGCLPEEECYITFSMLRTPFDWSGFDKNNWWKKNKDDEDNNDSEHIKSGLPISINEAFVKGESVHVEFKPGLINWSNSERDMEFEIAITISAFLNAKGGYLFIGVADKQREVIGLKFPNNSKDKFLREFTRIKTRFLPPHIAHTINGEFYQVDNVEIFVVTVFPSNEPVFIKKKDGNNRLIRKEFYVRSDAASRHLYDIEEVVKYCKNNWKDY